MWKEVTEPVFNNYVLTHPGDIYKDVCRQAINPTIIYHDFKNTTADSNPIAKVLDGRFFILKEDF
jgi:hypothetical protein